MEWINKFNEAMRYIERNLEGKIVLEEVARIACCSPTRFMRMFDFVTDMTLSEYIRNRKMSLAADDIKNSDIKVIDLAYKYGYESPEAFTRAFQSLHGMPPTTVRKLGISTDFPAITFQSRINGGNVSIGTKPVLRIEDCSLERVVTFFVSCTAPEEAAGIMLHDWAVNNINDYMARRFVSCAPKGHHPEGEHHQSDEAVGSHEYLMQMFLLAEEGNLSIFHGMEVGNAPEGLFIVGDVALNEFDSNGNIDIGSFMQTAFGIISECLNDMKDYEFDLENRRYREEHIFTAKWWEDPKIKDAGLQGFKLWLPIKKKY